MLKIGVMETAVHDEVLAGEVGEHDHGPTDIGLYLLEFQEGQEVVAQGEEQAAHCDKSERVRSGLLVTLERARDHQSEGQSVHWEQDFVGHLLQQHRCVANEHRHDDQVSHSSTPNVAARNVPNLVSEVKSHDIADMSNQKEASSNDKRLSFIGHEKDIADEARYESGFN